MNERLHELHIQLQDLLAGYADDMLDEIEKDRVEAHLAGCEACRLDVVRQKLLNQRLSDMPLTRMSTELHQRLDQVITDEASASIEYARQVQKFSFKNAIFNGLGIFKKPMFAITSGWGVALLLLVVMLLPSLKMLAGSQVPMVHDVLAEYRHFSHIKLPLSDDASELTSPASWPNSRVISRWKTKIGGASADAFAVRNGDSVVFQFRVNEKVFFNNPKVRDAILNKGLYQESEENLKVMAMPLKDGGLLIVGPYNKLPNPKKLKLNEV